MPKQSAQQKKTVERVMHEYKHGELKRPQGGKVKNSKQAIAIALHEAGASKGESSPKNRENLRKTKSKERRGATGQTRAEGKRTEGRHAEGRHAEGRHAEGKRKARSSARGDSTTTRAELYEQAKRRDISGRSRMSKAELARAPKR